MTAAYDWSAWNLEEDDRGRLNAVSYREGRDYVVFLSRGMAERLRGKETLEFPLRNARAEPLCSYWTSRGNARFRAIIRPCRGMNVVLIWGAWSIPDRRYTSATVGHSKFGMAELVNVPAGEKVLLKEIGGRKRTILVDEDGNMEVVSKGETEERPRPSHEEEVEALLGPLRRYGAAEEK